ncbi:MAG: hypothetical protein ACR2QK_03430 [Acidimicrobiales bacterium]
MTNTTPTPTGSQAATGEETANKPLHWFSMVPAPEIQSYDDVPWYRKTWFIFFPLFIPVGIIMALTGDVYVKANQKMKERSNSEAEVWRSTIANRACIIVGQVIFVAAAVNVLWP